MSITANKGEFVIVSAPVRPVDAHPRAYAVTFSPSSSASRFEIRDAGQRYEIRLVDGAVELKTGDDDWLPLHPKGRQRGVSYIENRQGDQLLPVTFDMIAASRGRLIAKETGIDRFYHLVLDPLFRTRELHHAGSATWLRDDGDPIVPSNYFKLDPGFFTKDAEPFVPDELKADYGLHPASVRFKVVALLQENETSDNICIPVMPRVWHVIDPRSPLKIFDLDDVKCIGDRELKEVATKSRIKNILVELAGDQPISAAIGQALESIAETAADVKSPKPIRNKLDDLQAGVNHVTSKFNDLVDLLERIPGVGDAIAGVRTAITAVDDEIESLQSTIKTEFNKAIGHKLDDARAALENTLVEALLDVVAGVVREHIEKDGFGALVVPAILAFGMTLQRLKDRGALKIVPYEPPQSLADAINTTLNRWAGVRETHDIVGAIEERFEKKCAERSHLVVHLADALQILLKENDNIALRRLISRLIESAAHHSIPNEPPVDIPTYVNVTYQRLSPIRPGYPTVPVEIHERRAIAYRRVLDLGMGTSHWSEQWQENFGGEIHSLLATYPIAQQERFSLMHYRLLNGPIIDGDGWCDGTTNFYLLVELDDKIESARIKGDLEEGHGARNPAGIPAPRFAILWHDEQTYFTQRWRLLHPTKDTAGDLFSLARALRDKPTDLNFDINRFWSPLENGCITRSSRMTVSRQIVALSGRDPQTGAHEIYTICFAFGICDHTWRWRPMPPADHYEVLDQPLAGGGERLPIPPYEVVYTNTLGIREDGTLTVRGFLRDRRGQLIEGRWVQKYLPADCRHIPHRSELSPGVKPAIGFSHPWEFVPEETYGRIDRHYGFHVYDDRTDSRCQYYEVDLLPDNDGVVPSVEDVTERIWRNGGDIEQPLTIDTIGFDWSLPNDDGFVDPERLFVNGRNRKTMSMYEPTTRFRLVERKPKGLIGLFWDKRDDDLQSASHLPRETLLVDDPPLRTPIRTARRPVVTTPPPSDRRIRVRIRANHRVLHGPVVQRADVTRVRATGGTVAVRVSFWTSQTIDEVHENLWRMHLAALDDDGRPIPLFTAEIFDRFTRVGVPAAPLPLGYSREDVLTPAYQYEGQLPVAGDDLRALVDRHCTAAGRRDTGASVWFEDVVGHTSAPEETRFLG